ncbi:Lipoxygenase [Glonium stellatum]|uniref:Manganese lipoxygenase n=1 Tax=Glonium stellatum TaxID=574774 RepID=A0A8E2F5V0_9PEZI|nr:Lipoxygenase [Glonium stellatum]
MATQTPTPFAEDSKLQGWDPAVWKNEVMREVVARQATKSGGDPNDVVNKESYNNAKKGLTATYQAIIKSYNSYFDMAGLETNIPAVQSLPEKKKLYVYTTDSGAYPPHLKYKYGFLDLFKKSFPGEERDPSDVFDQKALADIKPIVFANHDVLTRAASLLGFIKPNSVKDFREAQSFADVDAYNSDIQGKKTETVPASTEKSTGTPSQQQDTIGDRPKQDWYTDAVFAQQQFTGTNPTTLTLASQWIAEFTAEAHDQGYDAVVKLLSSADKNSLYVQDCSYFRQAIGLKFDQDVMVKGELLSSGPRYTPCSVALFQLDNDGRLHPLAIIIDYKGSIKNSVVIFNKNLDADAAAAADQKHDWPWRYAKTCAQVSDWLRHEIGIHLTDTHLLEEAIIVATHRTISVQHPVYRLLSPHWYNTLSLNASARDTLVPQVIIPISGVSLKQGEELIRYTYENFNFTDKYIPNDLEKRGFPLSKLGDWRCSCSKKCSTLPGEKCQAQCGDECHQLCDRKFHNYAYARNMKIMWAALRDFVKGFLTQGSNLTSDEAVLHDEEIQNWWKEIISKDGARVTSFPQIKTLDALIDAVTMCIHIASPQHTAINYLQEYYQTFVVNKPPALCQQPPTKLEQLQQYKEKDVIAALPVKRAVEWLLAAQIPTLLSMKVAEELNLVTYAIAVYNAAESKGDAVKEVASQFLYELWQLSDTFDPRDKSKRLKRGIFSWHSDDLDDQDTPYHVMDPVVTAVSILI